MLILLLCGFSIFGTIDAGLGNYTGRPPWYWKPSTTTTTQTEEPSNNQHQRYARQTNWLELIENRKNQSSLTWAQPTIPAVAKPANDCPKDVIHDRLNGKGYFFSWEDRRTSKLKMPWVQAVNFCRARCLELVSIETPKEHEFLAKHLVAHKIKGAWTSGRKCDFHGCEERPELQPADVYGWFWEGSRIVLPPTTDRFDVLWSNSGAHGKPQPDDGEGKKGGERESCLAVLNNAYNDGVSWHDQVCSKRKPIICEERDAYLRPEVKSLEETPHNFQHVLVEKIVLV